MPQPWSAVEIYNTRLTVQQELAAVNERAGGSIPSRWHCLVYKANLIGCMFAILTIVVKSTLNSLKWRFHVLSERRFPHRLLHRSHGGSEQLPIPAQALTIKNVAFADSTSIGEKAVSLRGAGLMRWLKLVEVYVAALYLPERTKPSEALSDIPKRLEISYLVAIKGADIGPVAETILARNVSGAELKRLRDRIDRLNAAYRDIKPGDRYALTYQPGKGTELSLNGEPLVTIEGADYAATYFSIWLVHKPRRNS
jgi:hypothetical protein